MSHNKIKVMGQSPNISGETNLNIADLGAFTSTTNKQIGFNSSGDVVQLDPPTSSGFKWIPTYHFRGLYNSWSGGSLITVGHRISLRKKSGIRDIDTSYAEGLVNGSVDPTWDHQVRLQAGTYLLNASFIAERQSSSDQCILRLKNDTDGTFHGNHTFWGDSQYSNNMYAYVSINAPKIFSFTVEAVSGTPDFQTNVLLQYVHFNIWRL